MTCWKASYLIFEKVKTLLPECSLALKYPESPNPNFLGFYYFQK